MYNDPHALQLAVHSNSSIASSVPQVCGAGQYTETKHHKTNTHLSVQSGVYPPCSSSHTQRRVFLSFSYAIFPIDINSYEAAVNVASGLMTDMLNQQSCTLGYAAQAPDASAMPECEAWSPDSPTA